MNPPWRNWSRSPTRVTRGAHHTLGTFLGIKVDGRLAAMIGERMTPGNYIKMTGICVHPEFRGHGYAQVLMEEIAKQIVARGEIPFLHVYSDNAPAIALYRRQGMVVRRTMHVTVLMLQSHNPHPI